MYAASSPTHVPLTPCSGLPSAPGCLASRLGHCRASRSGHVRAWAPRIWRTTMSWMRSGSPPVVRSRSTTAGRHVALQPPHVGLLHQVRSVPVDAICSASAWWW